MKILSSSRALTVRTARAVSARLRSSRSSLSWVLYQAGMGIPSDSHVTLRGLGVAGSRHGIIADSRRWTYGVRLGSRRPGQPQLALKETSMSPAALQPLGRDEIDGAAAVFAFLSPHGQRIPEPRAAGGRLISVSIAAGRPAAAFRASGRSSAVKRRKPSVFRR